MPQRLIPVSAHLRSTPAKSEANIAMHFNLRWDLWCPWMQAELERAVEDDVRQAVEVQ